MDTVREPGTEPEPLARRGEHDWRRNIEPADLTGERWVVVALDPVRSDEAADVVLFDVHLEPTTTMGRIGISISFEDEDGEKVVQGRIAPPTPRPPDGVSEFDDQVAASVPGGLELVADMEIPLRVDGKPRSGSGARRIHLRRLAEGVTELECPCCSETGNVTLIKADGVGTVLRCPPCRGARVLREDHDNRWRSGDDVG